MAHCIRQRRDVPQLMLFYGVANGKSTATAHICSGMGAEEGGCRL